MPWHKGEVRVAAPCARIRPAQVRELPKTMLAAKSFEKTTSPAALARWLRILAEELAERLAADGAENARRPRSLSVTYRCPGSDLCCSDLMRAI